MALLTSAPETADAKASEQSAPRRAFDGRQLVQALPGAVRRLNPASLTRNPVMLLVWVGAAFTTVLAIAEPFLAGAAESGGTAIPPGFTWGIAAWLWLTVFFANVAESVAEGRGKAQAATLRRTRTSTLARRVVDYDAKTDAAAVRARAADVASAELQRDDVVVVEAGELIPGDGDIIAGIATVDESAITGESAPVIRESGGDRSAVTGGTRVLSDRIVVRITSKPGETFVDRMIALVEGANRQRTPNEIALNILLASLSIVFVVAVLTLNPIASYAASPVSIPVLIALLVCLIPTTIGALLSAIGIAGMDRLVQRNVLAMSGRAVEAAGDVTTLLLDKTGTITYGNRRADEVLPLAGVDAADLLRTAALSSLADPTPEGASIVDLAAADGIRVDAPADAVVVPFTAQLVGVPAHLAWVVAARAAALLVVGCRRPDATYLSRLGPVASWLIPPSAGTRWRAGTGDRPGRPDRRRTGTAGGRPRPRPAPAWRRPGPGRPAAARRAAPPAPARRSPPPGCRARPRPPR